MENWTAIADEYRKQLADMKAEGEALKAGKITLKTLSDYQKLGASMMNNRQIDEMVDDMIRHRMLVASGLSDHPKAHKIWVLAWEYGQAQRRSSEELLLLGGNGGTSNGYHEVWSYLFDLAELVKDDVLD